MRAYNFAFNDPVHYNDVSGAEPSAEQRAIWEADRKANTEKAREDVRKLTFNNRYMYGVVGDDELFPKEGVLGHRDEYTIVERTVTIYGGSSSYNKNPRQGNLRWSFKGNLKPEEVKKKFFGEK